MCKAEVPDLNTQMRILSEFTSTDVQESSRGFPISDTFMLLTTTVQWISGIEKDRISEDKKYLLNAQIEMKEESYARYDRIRFSEIGDRFDPFNMHGNMGVRNSYISVGARSFAIDSDRDILKKNQIYNNQY